MKKNFKDFLGEASGVVDIPIPANMGPPDKKRKDAACPARDVAGHKIFDVDSQTWMECTQARKKGAWWDKYTKTKGMGQFMKENPKAKVMIRHKNHYLKVR